MSQQPYMYSPYTGRQAQQAYPYSSTPGQPPGLTFGAPPTTSPGGVAGTFAAANRSFEYNASMIPGLGMGGSTSPSFPALLFRAENKPLWPQGLSEASTPATPSGAAATPTRPAVGGGQSQVQAPASAPASGHASQTPRRSGTGDALEEGELSENESEDIYEPKQSPEGTVNKANQAFRPASTAVDPQGSAGDADGSSIYDTGSSREEVMVDSASTSLPAVEENEEEYSPGGYEDSVAYQPRDRSGSYSPYLSPREVQKEAPGARRSLQETRTAASQHHVPVPASGAANDVPSSRKVPAQAANGHAFSASAHAQRSAAEAKKKAQEAILGLWPLKVRYQDYIDEGLDPAVVKKLFTDLGLDMSSPKTTNTSTKPAVPVGVASNSAAPGPTPASAPAPSPASLNASPTSAQPQPTNLTTSTTTNNMSEMTMVDKKSEERKDKIARMLAEKKQKSAPPSSLNAVTIPSSTASAPKAPQPPAADSKAKTKAENTLKLQQKLAILRKAQEENEAKKKREQVAVIQPSSAPTSHGDDQAPSENTPGADSTPAPSKQVSPSVDPEAASPVPGIPGIPGLNLPAHQVVTKSRVAKRPVAADFDAYPPASGFLKRNRTQERLIIDVSDDEDVEMDIGSPVDGPAGGIQVQSSNTPNRPNSLGAFPPLSTTTTWRHKSSPVQTPPERGNKLDFLHRQIEEAKRKIAEAEAKKKANRQSNGTSSPLAQTPAPAEASLSKVSKPSDQRKSTPRASSERRERIASVQLPLLESALREKQEKLKRLQMEASQLELEVQASLAERQKLALEMSTLDDSNGDDTDESAPLSPPNNPDSTASIIVQPDAASTPLNGEAELTASAAQPTGLIAQEESDPEISDGKSEMDIDSTDSSDSSSSAAEDLPVDIGDNKSHAGVPDIEAMDTEDEAILNTAMSPLDPLKSETDSQMRQSSKGVADDLAVTGAGNMPSQSETQAVNDADASLQASVARVSPAGDDFIPAQISRTDQTHISDDEEGEVIDRRVQMRASLTTCQILDEDPYEPSLAAPAGPVSEPAAQAPTGEVQLRPSGESLLLTSEQTDQAPPVPVQDLLSYESPLRYFRAYRFHPKYADSVRGGLRSKTYSSKVRSDVPLCPSSGERDTCPNGSSCQYQHFSDMAATDSDIIASLGSVDSYSRDQRGRFIEGLKKVLSDLKSDPNRVKNFDSITTAILEYRRDFFGGDETKVLPLDGVSI